MANVIGIDLGTTNTVVAVVRDGQAQIVPTQEGDTYIPSVVCSDPAIPDFLLVGMPAKAVMRVSQDAVYSTKRLMGMLYFDEAEGPPPKLVEDYKQFVKAKSELAYKLHPDPEGKDELVRVKVGGQFRKAEDIAELILRKAKQDAELYTGAPVTGAVITTPAYFESKQKQATERAAKQAGLEVLALMDEPNAAAVAAGYRPGEGAARWVLVFDLGGGTFDVSLLQIKGDKFHVYRKGGDNWLGGDDFDTCLVNYVEEHARHIASLKDSESFELRRSQVKPAVEDAKIALSTKEKVTISIPGCALVRPAHGGQPRQVSVSGLEITRSAFEEMTRLIVDKALADVAGVLNEAPGVRGVISEVLLIGGSTYVPAVRRAIGAQFPGKVRIGDDINPMHEVARGAAIYADTLVREKEEGQRAQGAVDIHDIMDRSLGIECMGSQGQRIFEILIPKNTNLSKAASEHRIFHTTRPDFLSIPVYAGEHQEAPRNRFQGNIQVDIDPPVDIGHPVHIKLQVTKDRLIKVHTRIDGRAESIHELEYVNAPVEEDWEENLDQALRACEHFLLQYGEYIDDAQKQDLGKLCAEGEKARNARIEAVRVAKRIKRLMFYTEQIGNQLFQVDQLVNAPALTQMRRSQLRELANQGKELYRLCQENPTAEHRAELKRFVTLFETFLGMAFREAASGRRGKNEGLLEAPSTRRD